MRHIYTAVLMLGVTSAVTAQTPPMTNPGDASSPHTGGAMMMSAGSLPSADFVSKAGVDGMAEVQLAQLALQKAQSDDVKKFAQQMITDHSKANDELKAIASSKHIPVPAQLDPEHQSMVQSLRDKSGAAFDPAYVSQMVTAHDKAISLFTMAKNNSDPDIAAFASKTLPTLQMHKQMVSKLQAAHSM